MISKGPSDGWTAYPKKDEWTTISLTVKDNVLTYMVGGQSFSTPLPSPMVPNTKPLVIGKQDATGFPLYFKGEMNNVVVTNQV